MTRETFDLGELVADTAERFAEEFARARCRVSIDVADPVTGSWDRMRLEQVFTNLFQNAVRYAPGTPVDISVRGDATQATVVVRDRGPGIPESEHTRIFERFVQAEGPRSFAGGFGLGLWIVKQVVEAHGGTVQLASKPGAGAAFTVTLPLS